VSTRKEKNKAIKATLSKITYKPYQGYGWILAHVMEYLEIPREVHAR
jgi:hypothetical protein